MGFRKFTQRSDQRNRARIIRNRARENDHMAKLRTPKSRVGQAPMGAQDKRRKRFSPTRRIDTGLRDIQQSDHKFKIDPAQISTPISALE